MSKKFSQIDFLNNLEYILINLENDKEKANSLENKIYFELSKDEIINYINDVYLKIKKWNYYYEIKKYELIISEYKMIEPIISELELCLADLENIFHMNGISYSLFQIGKILSNIKKEYDENGR
jgi:hypothetical protein